MGLAGREVEDRAVMRSEVRRLYDTIKLVVYVVGN